MSCKVNVAEQTVILDLFVGGHRLRLIGPDMVYVEALSSKGEWLPCRFPPWECIIDALKTHLEPRLEVVDLGWELTDEQ